MVGNQIYSDLYTAYGIITMYYIPIQVVFQRIEIFSSIFGLNPEKVFHLKRRVEKQTEFEKMWKNFKLMVNHIMRVPESLINSIKYWLNHKPVFLKISTIWWSPSSDNQLAVDFSRFFKIYRCLNDVFRENLVRAEPKFLICYSGWYSQHFELFRQEWAV